MQTRSGPVLVETILQQANNLVGGALDGQVGHVHLRHLEVFESAARGNMETDSRRICTQGKSKNKMGKKACNRLKLVCKKNSEIFGKKFEKKNFEKKD